MKIAVVSSTPVPPAYGGMDRLLEGLTGALRTRHETELVTIPVDERSREGVLRGYFDFHQLDLSAYDRVISYKAPAYMVNHPNQVTYLSHRMRVFYDLYQPGDAEHERMRELIHFLDGWALDKKRIPHLFTVGETVSLRLRRFGNIESVPIHHPTTFKPAEPKPGSCFISVGRLHPWKRIDLIIRAFRRCRADLPLRIIGEGPQEEELRELAAGDARIEFLGKVDEAALAEAYAGALATIFPPISEDMGLITFESLASGKPVLTTTDAGEPALIVEEGRTGFVVEATPEALAEKLNWIGEHREQVEAMREDCLARMKEVTWERLIDALLGAGDDIAKASGRAPSIIAQVTVPARPIRLLVTDNQIIDPPVGGGRVRILELYRHMPEDFTTTYIGAFDYPGPAPRDQQYAANFREILTPLTAPHFKAHNAFVRLTGGEATVDVTMPVLGRLTPRYRRLLETHLPEADILISAHPWMVPFFPPTTLPRVYDSQNCEAAVKAPMLSKTLAGRFLASRVKAVERRAIEESGLVLACSAEDARSFTEMYGTEPGMILEIPNGVDCKVIRPASLEERNHARRKLGIDEASFVIFTGSNYLPNLEGAEFIVRELASQFPKVLFGIAGGVGLMLKERNPELSLPENVRLFGFVEFGELLDIYRAADAALNPMRQGSGTNIKMLDYLAAGLPILTTAKGARGLRGDSGSHWIEAELERFPAEFGGLLDGEDTPRRLAAMGRELAEALYDWTGISSRLAERLRGMAGR